MVLTCTIRHPKKQPLGSAQEIKRHISVAFSDVHFAYEAEEPPGMSGFRTTLPLFWRSWLSVFGRDVSYPRYRGYFESKSGGAVEFYFNAHEPIFWIEAKSYGMTAGLDKHFDHLSTATGWTVRYPR